MAKRGVMIGVTSGLVVLVVPLAVDRLDVFDKGARVGDGRLCGFD